MHLDRTRAQEQLAGDLPVGPARGHHPQDLQFPAGQAAVGPAARRVRLPSRRSGRSPSALRAPASWLASGFAPSRRAVRYAATRCSTASSRRPAAARTAAARRCDSARSNGASWPCSSTSARANWSAGLLERSRRAAPFRPARATARTSPRPDRRQPRSGPARRRRPEYRRRRRTRRRTSSPSAAAGSHSAGPRFASSVRAAPSSDRPPTAWRPRRCPRWPAPSWTAAPSAASSIRRARVADFQQQRPRLPGLAAQAEYRSEHAGGDGAGVQPSHRRRR